MRLFLIILLLACSRFSGYAINIAKDVSYSGIPEERNLLDVYYKTKFQPGSKDVIVFIHGGSWRSGHKETYTWLGKNFVRRGVVTVIINYSLSPQYQYEQMGHDCAKALKWTRDNISKFGGNPARIFVMGHSAGGHLAELINADPKYFSAEGISNPIHGMILNDAFGLDIHQYLTNYQGDAWYRDFIETFTENPETWKKGSPLTYKSNISNPHLILIGEKTYPSIIQQGGWLENYLRGQKIAVQKIIRPRKKHIGMISYMFLSWNRQYKMITDFMKQN